MGIFDDIPDEETSPPASPAGNDAAAENWMLRGTSGRTDPTQLGLPAYYDDLPEMERNKGPKDRSLSVLANQGMLGYLPYARAGVEAQNRGESYWGGTDRYERQRKALQQYYNEAYEASPDTVKVLGGVGLPGGPMAQAGKYLTSAARPIASGAGLGAAQAGVAGYLAPIEPATGDVGERLKSAAAAVPMGVVMGAAAGSAGKAAQEWQRPQTSTPGQLEEFHQKVAETAPAPSPFSENARAAAAIHDRGRLIEDQRGAEPARETAPGVPPEKPGPATDLFGDIPDEAAPALGQLHALSEYQTSTPWTGWTKTQNRIADQAFQDSIGRRAEGDSGRYSAHLSELDRANEIARAEVAQSGEAPAGIRGYDPLRSWVSNYEVGQAPRNAQAESRPGEFVGLSQQEFAKRLNEDPQGLLDLARADPAVAESFDPEVGQRLEAISKALAGPQLHALAEPERGHITETPEFKNWFGESKVVDQSGFPQVMYRGSQHENAAPYMQNGMIFLSPSRDFAGKYASGENGKVFDLYAKAEQPFDASRGEGYQLWKEFDKEHPEYRAVGTSRGALPFWTAERALKEWLDARGVQYDGIYFGENDGSYSLAVKSPTQIKSATGNRGAFDPNDPRITHALAEHENTDTLADANQSGADQAQPPANEPPDRTQLQRRIVEALNAGQPHEVHPQTVAESHAVIRAHQEEIPSGIQVGTLSRIEPLPDGRSVKFTFQTPQGKTFSDIRPDADLFGSRALFDPRKQIVALFEFGGLGAPNEVQRSLAGGIRHEGVHASRFLGQYTPAEWDLLLSHAENNLQSLDWDLYQWGKLLGRNPSPALRGISLRNQYENAYAGYPEAVRDEYMNEEAIAHMVEGYHHISQLPSNHPLYQSVMPLYRDVEPVLAKMFSGEIAARAPQSGVEATGQRPVFATNPEAQPVVRNIDPLGYYSQALEAAKGLKQAKGTPEQMLAQLEKGGAKKAEIEATNLRQFLEGKKSVTRDEIVKFLEENRVGLKEVNRRIRDDAMTPTERATMEAKWAPLSLDPNNPTYRETVLHLPNKHMQIQAEMARLRELGETGKISQDEFYRRIDPLQREIDANPGTGDFQSSHFPEPNITGHLMTSQVKDAAGKPVLLLDQIQDDWNEEQEKRTKAILSQRLFGIDGYMSLSREQRKVLSAEKGRLAQAGEKPAGVRDDARIAGLRSRVEEAEQGASRETDDLMKELRAKGWPESSSPVAWANEHVPELGKRLTDGGSERTNLRRLRAELKTAESAVPGHPLVNTTDQWVRTTLRRAIAQAVEFGAESIAIPSGDTVLSYNPGNEHGMREFYGKIVPLALKKLMRGHDAAYPEPQRVEKLETPSKGPAGKGFTVFPITDAVRASVARGQPLFARGGAVRRTSIKEAARCNAWRGNPDARAAMRSQAGCAH